MTSSQSAAVWAALIPCFLASLVFGLLSDGCYHDDDLTHYLMARWVRWFPDYLLHIWGRPGLTVPMATVAWIGDRQVGWHVARVLSAVATAAGALIAARLGMRLGIRRVWLIVACCYLQPLSAVLSFTTLTENWAGLYLIGAIALLHRASLRWASLVFSLTLVTRHEAIVLLPVWWLAVWSRPTERAAKWTSAAASLWAPVLHNGLFFWRFEEWPIAVFVQPHGSTEFGPTSLVAYVPHALFAMTPLVAGLAMYGGFVWVKRGKWIIPAVAGVFFMTQVLIKALGLYASGGYGRFMVAVAPLTAVLAAAGLEELLAHRSRNRGEALKGTQESCQPSSGTKAHIRLPIVGAGLLAVITLAQIVWIVRPLAVKPEHLEARRMAQWLREGRKDERPLFMTHPWLVYELDLAENPLAHKGPALLASMPVGTIFIWDSTYSANDFHGFDLEAFRKDRAHYEPISGFVGSRNPLTFEVFRKMAETPVPTEPVMSYPEDLASRKRPFRGVYYVRVGRN